MCITVRKANKTHAGQEITWEEYFIVGVTLEACVKELVEHGAQSVELMGVNMGYSVHQHSISAQSSILTAH